MSWLLRKMLQKAAQINPTDVFTQTNADDIISILKELLL